MTCSLLVLRPEPGASATVARAGAEGLSARAYPLFAVQPVAWEPPDPAQFDAILFTSANAMRHGGAALQHYLHLPAFAVGKATGDVACAAGFGPVHSGASDVTEVLAELATAGHRTIFHPAGREVRDADPGGLFITRTCVYASVEAGDATGLAAMLEDSSIVLVHSPRAGARLAALVGPEARSIHHVVAISPAAQEATGGGWASTQAAAMPDDKALLALAAKLCQ